MLLEPIILVATYILLTYFCLHLFRRFSAFGLALFTTGYILTFLFLPHLLRLMPGFSSVTTHPSLTQFHQHLKQNSLSEIKLYTMPHVPVLAFPSGFTNPPFIVVDQIIPQSFPENALYGVLLHEYAHLLHLDHYRYLLFPPIALIFSSVSWYFANKCIRSQILRRFVVSVSLIVPLLILHAHLRHQEVLADRYVLRYINPSTRIEYFTKLASLHRIPTYEQSLRTPSFLELFLTHPLIHRRISLIIH